MSCLCEDLNFGGDTHLTFGPTKWWYLVVEVASTKVSSCVSWLLVSEDDEVGKCLKVCKMCDTNEL